MPANPKYLTYNPWQRFAKISAGLVGGYLVAASTHLALAAWSPYRQETLITSIYSMFLMWVLMFLIAFVSGNGWKVWIIYLVSSLAIFALAFYGKQLYPAI
ncbi:MAG: hypothetical protein HRT66_13625 [Flavobacteriaceae bacterium]|nr:hypothetical protein [Flavobacteriaceae bacterium]